jgi:uncharacterized membrane protein YgcG
MGLVRKYAVRGASNLVYDGRGKRDALIRESRLTFFGFELERDEEVLDEFPEDSLAEARHALAMALARGETRHVAVKRNGPAIEEVRELFRRSGGTTGRLGMVELAALYQEGLRDVHSMRDFRAAPLRLSLADWVPPEVREQLLSLPSYVDIRDKPVGIDYDVEETVAADGAVRLTGVARLVMPEKLARTLAEVELPRFDRPLRFIVHRGQRGSVRAETVAELQELLDRPWSAEEPSGRRRGRDDERQRRGRERDVAKVRGQFARDGRHGRQGSSGKRSGGTGSGGTGSGGTGSGGTGSDRRGSGEGGARPTTSGHVAAVLPGGGRCRLRVGQRCLVGLCPEGLKTPGAIVGKRGGSSSVQVWSQTEVAPSATLRRSPVRRARPSPRPCRDATSPK